MSSKSSRPKLFGRWNESPLIFVVISNQKVHLFIQRMNQRRVVMGTHSKLGYHLICQNTV
jgi:hypothetical protein